MQIWLAHVIFLPIIRVCLVCHRWRLLAQHDTLKKLRVNYVQTRREEYNRTKVISPPTQFCLLFMHTFFKNTEGVYIFMRGVGCSVNLEPQNSTHTFVFTVL